MCVFIKNRHGCDSYRNERNMLIDIRSDIYFILKKLKSHLFLIPNEQNPVTAVPLT